MEHGRTEEEAVTPSSRAQKAYPGELPHFSVPEPSPTHLGSVRLSDRGRKPARAG
jgi:hypothetical protein